MQAISVKNATTSGGMLCDSVGYPGNTLLLYSCFNTSMFNFILFSLFLTEALGPRFGDNWWPHSLCCLNVDGTLAVSTHTKVSNLDYSCIVLHDHTSSHLIPCKC